MKLDFECIRDILLTLEQQSDFVYMSVSSFSDLLPQYSHAQIIYTLLRLYEGNYIHLYTHCLPHQNKPSIDYVGDLTFKGHEFLADIKPKNNWDKISTIFKQGGSASFKTVANIAITLGTEALKTKLGLNS